VIAVIKYPPSYSPILEYWEQIENGLVVSDKIKRTYKKLVQDLTDNTSEFYYNPKRANHVIEFVENYCRHSKGKCGGKPVILELWEKAMLAAVFGFVDIEGNRKYREAMLIVGKKNGKSLLASAVGLYLLAGDCEPGPEVYAVATKRDQAKIIWQEAKRMVKKSPALLRRIKPLVAELNSEDYNDGVFKPLASDSDTLDGLNIHGVLMDEIHQWKNGKPLYDIMADGGSAREQPLIFITSTAGTIREDIYDEKYDYAKSVIDGYFLPDGYKDERFIAFIYELDKREEWENPECWVKANPGLGTIKNRQTLAEKVAKAKKNKNLVKNLLCKEFNIRETSTEAWLPYESCVNETLFDMEKVRHSYAIGGCDLSATTDLTCATLLLQKPSDPNLYVLQKYFLPRARVTEVEENSKKEAPYEFWAEQGWLTICESATVDYHAVTQWFVDMVEQYDIRPLWIAYDAALSGYWVPEMQERGFEMEHIRQGPITWSYPMKRLGGLLEEHKIIYNNNPMLRWCLLNTKKKSTNENGIETIQPVKEKTTKRIDGMVSLLNAFVGYNNHEDEYGQYVR
jgi:phage terminase large subunit-like protein